MDTYSSEIDKLAFLGRCAQKAKHDAIDMQGVGSDLPHMLVGWLDGEVQALIYCSAPMMSNLEWRFNGIVNGSFALRRGYNVDSVTFISDGYSVRAGADELPDDTNLGELFMAGHPEVFESLMLLHVDKWALEAQALSLLYKVVPGPSVEYYDTLWSPMSLEAPYAKFLAMSLDVDFQPEIDLGALTRWCYGQGLFLHPMSNAELLRATLSDSEPSN